jgi:glycosyltransferase involved in cell wall biosynthesis
VLLQSYPAIDYVVMDGGSTDGTRDILKRYEKWLRWVSESDSGQSHAINKGLTMADGEILAYLNSDDTYLPGCFFAVAKFFQSNPSVGLVYGECAVVDESGNNRGFLPRRPFDLRRMIERGEFLPQQATFWKRSAQEKVGLFEEGLCYAMDYDYFIRMGKTVSVAHLHLLLASFRMHGISKTVSQSEKHWRESLSVSENHGLSNRKPWYWIRRFRHWGLLAMPWPVQNRIRQYLGRAHDPHFHAPRKW